MPLAGESTATTGTFGGVRVLVGSHDITRTNDDKDAYCIPVSWGSIDPGGHSSASFILPTLTVDQAWDDLPWYRPGAQIQIDQVRAGSVVRTLWRGKIRKESNPPTVLGGFWTLECDGDLIGPMSWVKDANSLRDPDTVGDIGHWISLALLDRSGGVELRPSEPVTGIKIARPTARSDSRWDLIQDCLALAQLANGTQWTILPVDGEPGVYAIGHRDVTTHDYKVFAGVQGVDLSQLSHDLTTQPNRYFGEGQRSDGGRYYNLTFPHAETGRQVAFPNTGGRAIMQGDTDDDTDSGTGVTDLAYKLARYGWVSPDDLGNSYDDVMVTAVERIQANGGLTVTGDVDENTWALVFPSVDGDNPSLANAHYEPFCEVDEVRTSDRAANGLILSHNPLYTPTVPVVDAYVNGGSGPSKTRFAQWCMANMALDQAVTREWAGQITLSTDPVDGDGNIVSRFRLQAGTNVYVPNFDGGTLFHIGGVTVNWPQGGSSDAGTVQLDVSNRPRDYLDLATLIARNKAARANPAKRWAAALNRKSFQTNDALTGWDIELGGFLDPTDLDAATWSVLPIFTGRRGSVARVWFATTDDPTEFCVAIFAKRVTEGWLNNLAPDPLASRDDNGNWTSDNSAVLNGQSTTQPGQQRVLFNLSGEYAKSRLLVYAAGTGTTAADAPMPCGYWPHADAGKADNDSLGTNLTGVWRDDASFDYWTFGQPVLWVAVWPRTATTIQGRLYASIPDGGM